MLLGVVVALVNPHTKRRIRPLAGCAEEDLARTGTQMSRRLVARSEMSACLDHELYAEPRPWEARRISL